MENKEIQKRNKEIALMLGANIQNDLKRIYIDKMVDDNLVFHDTSVDFKTYEFDGTNNVHYISFDLLQFHLNWDWLMEAVEFIKSLKETKGNCKDSCYMITTFSIYKNGVLISYENGDLHGSIRIDHTDNGKYFKDVGYVDTAKEAVFIAVSDFAKKYNNKEII